MSAWPADNLTEKVIEEKAEVPLSTCGQKLLFSMGVNLPAQYTDLGAIVRFDNIAAEMKSFISIFFF